jgi:hypothetical protein
MRYEGSAADDVEMAGFGGPGSAAPCREQGGAGLSWVKAPQSDAPAHLRQGKLPEYAMGSHLARFPRAACPKDPPVSFLDHIRVCNDHDLDHYLPFHAAGQRVGWVERGLAESLRDFADALAVSAADVSLNPALRDFDSRTHAMAKVARALHERNLVPGWHNEEVAVASRFGIAPLFKLERSAAPLFGVTALGVHVNGIVRDRDEGLKMWIARRSPNKPTYPGMLDNLCAGGIIYGHGVRETLIKEAGEEASIPRALSESAVPSSAITYCCERDGGLRPDIIFAYDLTLPPDFVPAPGDDEIEDFTLRPIDEVIEIVRNSFDFKFNCNLVIIDFLVRHGFITPDEPDYIQIVTGLRQ